MTRTRTRTDIPLKNEELLFSLSDGSVVDQVVGSSPVALDTSTIVDTPTPNFLTKIGEGEVINHPMSMMRENIKNFGAGYASYQGLLNGSPYGPISYYNGAMLLLSHGSLIDGKTPFESIVDIDYEEAINVAKQKAIADIQKDPFGFGEDLGELKSTLLTIRRSIFRLKDIITKYKRERRKLSRKLAKLRAEGLTAQAAAVADELTDLWLSYRFFVRPIIKSSVDAIDAFSLGATSQLPRANARGFDMRTAFETEDVTVSDRVYTRKETETFKVHATILYTVDNPIKEWRNTLGLENDDLLPTLWQLFPYSFMIDRVADITSFITGVQNLVNPKNSVLAASVTTQKDNYKTVELTQGYSGNAVIAHAEDFDTYTIKTYNRDRVVWEPSFSDTLPDFDLEGLFESVSSIADLAALTWAAIRR